jgi:hypothetical protein
MSENTLYFGEWPATGLVDPRGVILEEPAAQQGVNSWPIEWKKRKVGLFSNKKPNADAMLEEVQRGLLAAAPDLTFVYGSKEPLAENAPAEVIESLSDCDVVVLASAECGGCTSWVCRDYITLEKRGVPCLVIATNRFEGLARSVLERGGITNPHLAVPKHPVSGIPAADAQAKIRDVMGPLTAEILGAAAAAGARQ